MTSKQIGYSLKKLYIVKLLQGVFEVFMSTPTLLVNNIPLGKMINHMITLFYCSFHSYNIIIHSGFMIILVTNTLTSCNLMA